MVQCGCKTYVYMSIHLYRPSAVKAGKMVNHCKLKKIFGTILFFKYIPTTTNLIYTMYYLYDLNVLCFVFVLFQCYSHLTEWQDLEKAALVNLPEPSQLENIWEDSYYIVRKIKLFDIFSNVHGIYKILSLCHTRIHICTHKGALSTSHNA